MFDYLIVGAGFSGAVLAERLASQLGKRVLVIDRRRHIGGNAFDQYDEAGVLVSPYGPQPFHTDDERVFRYLSQFTDWRPYEHRILGSIGGRLEPLSVHVGAVQARPPIEIDLPVARSIFDVRTEPGFSAPTAADALIAKVGRDRYDAFLRGELTQRWGMDPSELDATTVSGIPVRATPDGYCFKDKHQTMPVHGFTKMFERILAHPNIKVMLQADYREVRREVRYDKLVYSGSIDEFFDYLYGKLPYRSARFEFETREEATFQPAGVVSYPNEKEYVRTIEFKHFTGQRHPLTTVAYEYPRATGEPFYPIPRAHNGELYRKYRTLAEATPDVHFVGRLGTYRQYEIDECVAAALGEFEKIRDTRAKLVAA